MVPSVPEPTKRADDYVVLGLTERLQDRVALLVSF